MQMKTSVASQLVQAIVSRGRRRLLSSQGTKSRTPVPVQGPRQDSTPVPGHPCPVLHHKKALCFLRGEYVFTAISNVSRR